MPITPCADPDCTCRSPDLQWFTEQVLRRDAAKTDYIVIPLVAGVLARAILAANFNDGTDPEGDQATRRDATAVHEIAERGRTASWEDDLHAYGVVASFVFCNWASLLSWGGVSYHRTTLGLSLSAPPDQRLGATTRYLGGPSAPSWTESVILAMIASVSPDRGEMPLLGKTGRRLRVVLADRLRRHGLVKWPDILRAAIDDWTLPALEQLAVHNAAAGDAAIHYAMDLAATLSEGHDAEPKQVMTAEPAGPASRNGAPPLGEAAAARELIEDTVAEIALLREQRAATQRERDAVIQRDSRLRSRLESLEQQLADERERRAALEREIAELRAERDRYVGRVAADDALINDAPPPPANTFAGRRVLFFTGVEAADARAAFAQHFRDLGAARVDTYWTDKTRGPDVFPLDAVIAVDVSLMAHTTWNAILDKAKAAGAWWYCGKHGATTMARATAAAWLKRRAP